MKSQLQNIALLLLSLLFTLICAEVLYRAYLYNFSSYKPTKNETASIRYHVYNKVPTIYNRKLGYTRPANQSFVRAIISEGRPLICSRFSTNEMGNVQRLTSEQKNKHHSDIFVFGDSFTENTLLENLGWPDLLADTLNQKASSAVQIENYSKSAFGVLQIVNQASETISNNKPELAIIAIIVNDLTRDRFWTDERASLFGTSYVTLIETAENDLTIHSERALIDSEVSMQWCEKLKHDKGHNDDLLDKLNRIYINRVRIRWEKLDFWGLNSMLLDTLKSLSRSGSLQPAQGNNPQIDYLNYNDDPHMQGYYSKIRASNTPVMLVLLPRFRDIQAKRYIMTPQQKSLLASLENGLGVKAIRLLNYIEVNTGKAEDLFLLPDDNHPSLEGNRAYTEAIAPFIFNGGYLDK